MIKPTIKLKIVIWYSVLLLALLSSFFVYMYFTMSQTMYNDAGSFLKLDAERAAEGLQITSNKAVFDEDIDYNAATSITVYDRENHLLLGQLPKALSIDSQPRFNLFFKAGTAEKQWLVYDLPVNKNGQTVAWVRAMRLVAPMVQTLKNLRLLIILALPVFFIIAALGGLLIVRHAFSPLDRIILTAEKIGRGDWHHRIGLAGSDDEVGRLALAFDEMMERLQTAFEREKQFTANASHELRTPTAVIMAQAEEALNGLKKPGEYQESLLTILLQSRKMSTLISQLLFLARGEEERQKPELEKVQLDVLVLGVVAEMQSAAQTAGIEIDTQLPDDIVIMADQTMITRLLINLIDNGIKYNQTGGMIRLVVNREKSAVSILVEDNGVGIAAEDLPRIWHRFYRAEMARSGPGNGLGLSLVKWIVEAHGGHISVDSVPGKGTRFLIQLPDGRSD